MRLAKAQMKRKFTILLGIAMCCLLLINTGIAQDRKIRVVKGRQLMVTGEVPSDKERSYFFKAKKGQTLTVKITGNDAAYFVLFAQHNFDAETFSEETRGWSGKLPRADAGEYAIRLGSYFRVATYRLEILLK